MFLFIMTGQGISRQQTNSNTSYVLIYHCMRRVDVSTILIQIHLMFLFIINFSCQFFRFIPFKYILCSYLSQLVSGRHLRFPEFKYILCSYLSYQLYKGHIASGIQIHLMFLFIAMFYCLAVVFFRIQIHLMFLFIKVL